MSLHTRKPMRLPLFEREARSPTLQSIAYAIVIAEHSSIRRAALRLRTRSSVVSRRLRSLEDRLGMELFERQSSGIRPTVVGREFLDRAKMAFAELEHATYLLKSAQKGKAGSLSVGFYPSLVSGMLHDILSEYRKGFPSVDLSLLEAAPSDQLAALRHQRIDVAVLIDAETSEDVQSECLWTERVFAALPQRHRLAANRSATWLSLRNEDFVVRGFGREPVVYAWLAGKLDPDGISPRIRQHDIGRDNLLGLVRAGFGITIVAESTIGQSVPGLVFRLITNEDAVLPVRVAWLPENENPTLGPFLSCARRVSRRVSSAAHVGSESDLLDPHDVLFETHDPLP